jgi:hypothetical protein
MTPHLEITKSRIQSGISAFLFYLSPLLWFRYLLNSVHRLVNHSKSACLKTSDTQTILFPFKVEASRIRITDLSSCQLIQRLFQNPQRCPYPKPVVTLGSRNSRPSQTDHPMMRSPHKQKLSSIGTEFYL